MSTRDALHYVVLVVMLACGISAVWMARGHQGIQLAIGSVTAMAYVGWGVLHHAYRKDLHRNIVIEYVLVGLIAVALLATFAF